MKAAAADVSPAPNPSGRCQCGCGEPTSIAPATKTAFGHVKGEPLRFVRGHRGRLNRVPAETEDEIVAMVEAAASTGAAARAQRVHISTVRAILRRRGRADLIRPVSEHPPNPDAFRRVTPTSAYWLGFLMADGSRGKDQTIRLKLRLSDRGHLEQFTGFLGCPQRRLFEGGDGRGNRTIGVHLRSAALSEDLERWGIVRRKSLDGCRAHPALECSGAFWRGILDGDGTGCFGRFRAPVARIYNSSRALLEQYVAFPAAHVEGPQARITANRTIWTVTLQGARGRAALQAMQAGLPGGLGLARKNGLVARAVAWRSQYEIHADRDARMAARYAAGDEVREIARAEGVRRATVVAAARRAGVAIRPRGGPRRVAADVYEQALRSYGAGDPIASIAATAGVHVGTIAYWCHRDGLPARGPGGAFPPSARRRAERRID